MAKQVLLSVSNNQGYAPDQIDNTMVLGTLLAAVQAAIEQFGADAQVVTMETGNYRGARFGSISTWEDAFSDANPDGECADCGNAPAENSDYCAGCWEIRQTS